MDSGVASARGSACSMEWTAAELLDTMRGRTGGGEHGYDEGTAMVASAMAWEREGEELGRMEVSRRVGARRGARPGHQGGERGRPGGVQLRGELRCRRRAPWLPAWRAKQLAGAVAGLGRPGGLAGGPVVAPGKFSLFFYFLFF